MPDVTARETTSRVLLIALSTCLGIIVTGAAAWAAFGQDKVTQEEMKVYVQERLALPEVAVKQNAKDIGEVTSAVRELSKTTQDLLVEQRVLVEKLDHLTK